MRPPLRQGPPMPPRRGRPRPPPADPQRRCGLSSSPRPLPRCGNLSLHILPNAAVGSLDTASSPNAGPLPRPRVPPSACGCCPTWMWTDAPRHPHTHKSTPSSQS
ncbi:hypothetical protein BS78_03G394900 [Paspalum vaginatum]|nr:hypothetical protein BS78_03G394900 [Paspalum vaginatum]